MTKEMATYYHKVRLTDFEINAFYYYLEWHLVNDKNMLFSIVLVFQPKLDHKQISDHHKKPTLNDI